MRELTEAVGEPQNLVSYHLRLLRAGGLVAAHRSAFDGRDIYYGLDLERYGDALRGDRSVHSDDAPAGTPAPRALPLHR